MKKTLAVIAVLGFLAVSYPPFLADAGGDHKVTICHATSSESSPYVRIVVDEHATGGHFDNNGTPESGHEDDILIQGEASCPEPEEPPEEPIDVCPNIDGDQETVPEGKEIVDEQCVDIETPPPPPDDEDPPEDNDPPDDTTPPDDSTPPNDSNPPSSNGGGGHSPSHRHTENTGGAVGGNFCAPVERAAGNFTVDTGTPNDGTLELGWEALPEATEVEIRYGHIDGVWLYGVETENDGSYSLGGLTNGQHYWLQVRAFNDCGEGFWSVSVDPLP